MVGKKTKNTTDRKVANKERGTRVTIRVQSQVKMLLNIDVW